MNVLWKCSKTPLFWFSAEHFSRWMNYLCCTTSNVIFGGHPRSFDSLYFAKMSQCLCVRHSTFFLLISPFCVRPLSLEIWCKLLEWTACGREELGETTKAFPLFIFSLANIDSKMNLFGDARSCFVGCFC